VPLRSSGFGLCLVARCRRGGNLLGYFFGPRFASVPLAADILRRPEDALLITWFGPLGIKTGTWKLIGCTPAWRESSWPIPVFGKVDLLNPDLAWSIEVDEKGREVNAIRVAPAIAKELFPYVLSGHGSAEIKLTKKIDEFEQLVK